MATVAMATKFGTK